MKKKHYDNYKISNATVDYVLGKNIFCVDGELYGINDEVLKDGDTILVADTNNKLMVTTYPYSGLMGMKVVFTTKRIEGAKTDSIFFYTDVYFIESLGASPLKMAVDKAE